MNGYSHGDSTNSTKGKMKKNLTMLVLLVVIVAVDCYNKFSFKSTVGAIAIVLICHWGKKIRMYSENLRRQKGEEAVRELDQQLEPLRALSQQSKTPAPSE